MQGQFGQVCAGHQQVIIGLLTSQMHPSVTQNKQFGAYAAACQQQRYQTVSATDGVYAWFLCMCSGLLVDVPSTRTIVHT